jgi:hypothetical protein
MGIFFVLVVYLKMFHKTVSHQQLFWTLLLITLIICVYMSGLAHHSR